MTNEGEVSQEYTEADLFKAQKENEELKKENQTLQIQKDKYREKAKEKKEEKTQVEEKKPQVDDTWREKMELKVEGHSDEAIEFIQQNGGRKSLDNPYVKNAISAMKEQAVAEGAMASDSSGKSELEKKYSEEDFKDLSVDEMEKLLPKT